MLVKKFLGDISRHVGESTIDGFQDESINPFDTFGYFAVLNFGPFIIKSQQISLSICFIIDFTYLDSNFLIYLL